MSDFVSRVKVPVFKGQFDAVDEALRTGMVASGPHLDLLRERLALLLGKKYVVLTSNGFAALMVSLIAKGYREREVVVPAASTCFAMTNAILASGNTPRFRDIEEASFGIDALGQNEVVISPDHFGRLATVNGEKSDCEFLVEDACQSFYSLLGKKRAADSLVMSLYPTKLINGIDGGVIATDDFEFYSRAKDVSNYTEQTQYDGIIRYNFKLNNLNAAMALGTLSVSKELIKLQMDAYTYIANVLGNMNINFLRVKADEVPSRLIVIAANSKQKSVWMSHLRVQGVDASEELIGMVNGGAMDAFPTARDMIARTFSIPLHPCLDRENLDTIAAAISELETL